MDGNKLAHLANNLETRKDFLIFLEKLSCNALNHPHEWENSDMPNFFEALSAWTQDCSGYYKNIDNNAVDIEEPSWRLFADMLLTAKIYE